MGSNWADATRLMREPDDRDLAPDPERQDELLREQRWTAFVAEARRLFRSEGDWASIIGVGVLGLSRQEPHAFGFERTCRDFADTEGWPAVLNAIARAMAEQEAEAAEIERRR